MFDYENCWATRLLFCIIARMWKMALLFFHLYYNWFFKLLNMMFLFITLQNFAMICLVLFIRCFVTGCWESRCMSTSEIDLGSKPRPVERKLSNILRVSVFVSHTLHFCSFSPAVDEKSLSFTNDFLIGATFWRSNLNFSRLLTRLSMFSKVS